jgi:hypothetical protein
MSEARHTEGNGAVQTEQGFRLLFTRFRRRFGKPRSLRRKLAQWNALVLLLTLALLEVIIYLAVTYTLINDVDQRLMTQATRLEALTRSRTVSGQPAETAFFHQLVSSTPINEFTANPLYIKLFDVHTGRLLAVSPYLNQTLLPFSRPDFDAALHGQQILGELQDVRGNQVHALTLPLYDKTQRLVAVAQVIQSLQVVQQVQAILLIVLGAEGPLAALAAYGLSVLLTSRELHPLSHLITTMHRLSEQHLEIRFHPQRLTTEEGLVAHLNGRSADEARPPMPRGDSDLGEAAFGVRWHRIGEGALKAYHVRPVERQARRRDALALHASAPVNELGNADQDFLGVAPAQLARPSKGAGIDDDHAPAGRPAGVGNILGRRARAQDDHIKRHSHKSSSSLF